MKFKALLLALLTIISPTIFSMEMPTAQEVSALHVLKVIDINGSEFSVNPELSHALLKCTNIETLQSHPGVLDFTGLNASHRPYLTQDKIRLLAFLIASPQSIESAELASKIKQLDFFEAANYLGAPDNILYLLSNELWPLMQEQKNDNEQAKNYKKYIRQLAKSHFACPRHLHNYLKAHPKIKDAFDDYHEDSLKHDEDSFIILSWDKLEKFYQKLPDGGWYTYEDSQWLIKYPFGSLDGIKELCSSLPYRYNNNLSINLMLQKHRLESFSCDLLSYIETLDLSDNNIKEVTGQQIKYTNRPPRRIILNGNPINSIQDSFFEALRNVRSGWLINMYDANRKNYQDDSGCCISLERTALTTDQKKIIAKKFTHATKTLPEQYLNKTAFEVGVSLAGALVGGIVSYYGLDYIEPKAPMVIKGLCLLPLPLLTAGFYFTNHSEKNQLLVTTLLLTFGLHKAYDKEPKAISGFTKATYTFFVGGGLGLGTGIGAACLTAYGLAKYSHPKMKWNDADRNLIWNKMDESADPIRTYNLKC